MVGLKQISIEKACKVVNLPRSMWYYKSKKDDSELEQKLMELSELLPHRGLDTYYGRLRNQGYCWGRMRVRRVYKKLNLQLRRKRKRRLPSRIKQPLTLPIRSNIIWSMDFMHDTLDNGRKFRVLNILDDFNREAISIEPRHSFSSERVVQSLSYIVQLRGKPASIRVDNGSEFIGKPFKNWCQDNQIEIRYIQPGRPMQNAYIERFNRHFREDILDAYIFDHITDVEELAEQWRNDYNNNHPHKSLMGMSPKQFSKLKNYALN